MYSLRACFVINEYIIRQTDQNAYIYTEFIFQLRV